jgi:hypothetical protein
MITQRWWGPTWTQSPRIRAEQGRLCDARCPAALPWQASTTEATSLPLPAMISRPGLP